MTLGKDLRNCCKACEKAGLLVFGDLVFNHMQAGFWGLRLGKWWKFRRFVDKPSLKRSQQGIAPENGMVVGIRILVSFWGVNRPIFRGYALLVSFSGRVPR